MSIYASGHPKHGQRTMHSTGEPVSEDGRVTRLIGNTLDITEQEELTQELRGGGKRIWRKRKGSSHGELRVET